MARLTRAQVLATAQAIVALDVERATQLETLASNAGLLPQVQEELDSLRHANRLEQRIVQLMRSRRFVAVDDV